MASQISFLTADRAIMLLLLLSFFVFLKSFLFVSTAKLEQDAEFVAETLVDGADELTLSTAYEIDMEKLELLEEQAYTETKKQLGVQSDFCVYFEHENGSLLKIAPHAVGFGSDKIKINGEPCE